MTDSITDRAAERLAAIAARLDAATDGPWSAAALAFGYAYHWGSEQTRQCTVTDRDRTTATDAADTYASLEPDHTYDITTIGWRIPALSQFPTVINVEGTHQ